MRIAKIAAEYFLSMKSWIWIESNKKFKWNCFTIFAVFSAYSFVSKKAQIVKLLFFFYFFIFYRKLEWLFKEYHLDIDTCTCRQSLHKFLQQFIMFFFVVFVHFPRMNISIRRTRVLAGRRRTLGQNKKKKNPNEK